LFDLQSRSAAFGRRSEAVFLQDLNQGKAAFIRSDMSDPMEHFYLLAVMIPVLDEGCAIEGGKVQSICFETNTLYRWLWPSSACSMWQIVMLEGGFQLIWMDPFQ